MSDDLTAAGVAPQELSQTETKSGNNFVSLDPEKVAAQGAEPQEESVPKSSYISPHLPAQIRGLYRADLREKSIQTMLDLAGDLIQELIDLRAAPVLPSSICQHNMVSYTDSVSEKPENFCSLCGYQPSSGVDVETLANLIHSTSVAHFGGLDPRVAPIIARAVAEFLKGEER